MTSQGPSSASDQAGGRLEAADSVNRRDFRVGRCSGFRKLEEIDDSDAVHAASAAGDSDLNIHDCRDILLVDPRSPREMIN